MRISIRILRAIMEMIVKVSPVPMVFPFSLSDLSWTNSSVCHSSRKKPRTEIIHSKAFSKMKDSRLRMLPNTFFLRAILEEMKK